MWNAVCNPVLECEERETGCKYFVNFVTCTENMPWVHQRYGDGCDSLMKDAKCARWSAERPTVCDEKRSGWEQFDLPHPAFSPDLAPSDFHLFLHSQILPCWPAVRRRKRGQRRRYHVLCIAGGIVLRWRDKKKLVLRYDKCLNNDENHIEK